MPTEARRTGLPSLLLALVLLQSTSLAITRRHDDLVSDADYLALGNSFPAVGLLKDGTTRFRSGVLISPSWMLTAAHVVYEGTSEVVFADSYAGATAENTYDFAEGYVNPNWNGAMKGTDGHDIGLVRLSRQVTDIAPALRYTGSGEKGQLVTWVGFGRSGHGYEGGVASDKTRRGAENVVDELGDEWDPEWSNNVLLTDFDCYTFPESWQYNRMGQRGVITEWEGGLATGDSGCGLFMEVDGTTYLVGIGSFAVRFAEEEVLGMYGNLSGATRVYANNAWIDSKMQANADSYQWNNPAGGSFNDPANWDGVIFGNVVPGVLDTARLAGTDAAAIVTLPGDLSTRRLIVDSGETTLDLQGHTYRLTEDGAAEAAAAIDDDLGGVARLEIRNGTLDAGDGSVEIGLAGAGRLDLDDADVVAEQLLLGPGGTLHADVTSDVTPVVAGAVTLGTGSVLSLEAGQGFPSIGDSTRSIIDTEDLDGSFTGEPAPGDHLGAGVFFRNISYSETSGAAVEVFQALAGDTDGDGDFDFEDLIAVFAESGPYYGDVGQGDRTWLNGDFTGDGDFLFDDLIAAFSLAGAYYEDDTYLGAAASEAPEGNLLLLEDLQRAIGLTGPANRAGMIVGTVPEPAGILMLLAGLSVFLMWRTLRSGPEN